MKPTAEAWRQDQDKQEQKMLLDPPDLELFFRLHRTLMFFVNQRLKVVPDDLATPDEFAALSPEVRLKVRDALNATPRSDRVLCR